MAMMVAATEVSGNLQVLVYTLRAIIRNLFKAHNIVCRSLEGLWQQHRKNHKEALRKKKRDDKRKLLWKAQKDDYGCVSKFLPGDIVYFLWNLDANPKVDPDGRYYKK
jgi:hypothetical protein